MERINAEVWEKHNGINLSIVLVPGDEGVKGNEKVDSKVKKAVRGDGSPLDCLPIELQQPLTVSSTVTKAAYKTSLPEQHRLLLKTAQHYGKIACIDPGGPSSKYRKLVSTLDRQQTSLLTRLEMGHVPLNHHLHQIGAWETPFCSHCKTRRETVFHFIMDCSTYCDQRTQLRDGTPQEIYTIGNLLSNKDCIQGLIHYVEEMGWLCQTFQRREKRQTHQQWHTPT
ncbi:hypothetical protein K439DRAFT_1349410 [Ramaria rubella]|nr:hypothetical protein K439DRAFT_1349410 [Ramaria rubella]